MTKKNDRVVELQRSLKIARDALTKIALGHCGTRGLRVLSPEDVASEALDQMFPLERKQPLQGLVGHERRRG